MRWSNCTIGMAAWRSCPSIPAVRSGRSGTTAPTCRSSRSPTCPSLRTRRVMSRGSMPCAWKIRIPNARSNHWHSPRPTMPGAVHWCWLSRWRTVWPEAPLAHRARPAWPLRELSRVDPSCMQAARPRPPHGRRLAGTTMALALLPGVACAQEATGKLPIDLPGIVVTGSHIGRAGFETSQPLIVLDRRDLQRAGLTSVGEILQQLPQHVSDLNSDYNNGGNGETRVDLRNLGARRTLVLLNGHRYVTALDGAVDVASIPLPIVDRIEVLTDGASAIYGSDAIAGVVNIITRDDYAGVEASAYYASNDHGDGERRAADITWGRQGERGGIALNLSFADQQPIWAGDRAISAVPTFNLPANDPGAGASQNTPQGRLGFGPHGVQLPDGSEGQLTWDSELAAHRPFDFRSDGYNFAPENYLRTPYERTALFGQADYQLGGQLRLRSELLLHRRRSSQQLAPTPLFQLGAEGDPYNFNIATDRDRK